jgi:hypothetical protein
MANFVSATNAGIAIRMCREDQAKQGHEAPRTVAKRRQGLSALRR